MKMMAGGCTTEDGSRSDMDRVKVSIKMKGRKVDEKNTHVAPGRATTYHSL